MTELSICDLNLASLSPPVEETFLDQNAESLNLSTKERLRNIFFSTYKWKTRKSRVEKLFRDTHLPDKPLILNTHGAYHHLTYGIISALNFEEEIGYVHIDNHTDADDIPEKEQSNLLFSSFTPDIAELPCVSSVSAIGSYHPSFSSLPPEKFVEGGWEHRLEEMLGSGPDSVYISVDLDVFHSGYCRPSFSQGVMNWSSFNSIIERFQEKKNILGADIVGLEQASSEIDRKTYRAVGRKIMGLDTDRENYLSSVKCHLEAAPESFQNELSRELFSDKYDF